MTAQQPFSYKINFSLKTYNTFGINANAKKFISITSKEILKTVLSNEKDVFILGGGSNMLLTKDIEKTVVHINLKGITKTKETDDFVWITAMAGENWHNFVLWCIKNNYGGVENLSLIPGNVGTTPIQNIGAYGVEIKDVLESCEAIKITDLSTKKFTNKECAFAYRESVFKKELKNKYIITSVTFKLTKNKHIFTTSYGAIETELNKSNKKPTLKNISDTVIAIREKKLPNPKELGNSGSFFKNPIINTILFKAVQKQHPTIPHYPISDTQVKIPAGWLIEQSGFKGKRFGDAGVHKNQALVLVNYGNAKGEEIVQLAQTIQQTVKDKFNISIEPEVNII